MRRLVGRTLAVGASLVVAAGCVLAAAALVVHPDALSWASPPPRR